MDKDNFHLIEFVDCPACGSNKRKAWKKNYEITQYVFCLGCGTLYASPRLGKGKRLDSLIRTFRFNEENLAKSISKKFKLEEEAITLKKFVGKGKILDIGCGFGLFLDSFPLGDWDRYGVEISDSIAHYCSENFNTKVFCGDLIDAKYPDNYFDLITLIDMIYYIDNLGSLFSEIHRILNPSGILGIELAGLKYIIHRAYGFIPLLINKRWDLLKANPTYINWLSMEGIGILLRRNGFELLHTYIVQTPESRGLSGKIVKTQANIINSLSNIKPDFLTWSPKLIYVAKPLNA